MTDIEDQLITRELNAAPGVAERTPELLRSVQSLNAEVASKYRRRSRGLGIAVTAGVFTLLGTTAAVAAPAIQLLWQPDYVMSYQSALAGECTFSMMHEVSPSDKLGLSDDEVRAAALAAIATLDLSEAGRAGMVSELLEKFKLEDPYAAHLPPHLTSEYVAGLSTPVLEEEAVFAAFSAAVSSEYEFRSWRVEGRMNLVCDGVNR